MPPFSPAPPPTLEFQFLHAAFCPHCAASNCQDLACALSGLSPLLLCPSAQMTANHMSDQHRTSQQQTSTSPHAALKKPSRGHWEGRGSASRHLQRHPEGPRVENAEAKLGNWQ